MRAINNTFATVELLETRTLMSASLGEQAMHLVAPGHEASLEVSKKQPAPKKQAAPKKEAAPKKQAAPKKNAKNNTTNNTVTPAVTPVTPAAPAIPAVSPEPTVTDPSFHYTTFSGDPLFASTGPSENDIVQGQSGDCYFLATLSAIAKTDPSRIVNSISNLGDGTFEVKFQRAGHEVDVRVDNELAVTASGQPAYAGLGSQNSLWVAIMEKAWTVFRSGADSYASINSGWMDEAFSALGATGSDVTSSANLLTTIQSLMAQGKAVTFAVANPADGASLIGEHAYTVDSIVTNAQGQVVGLRLRNPWGIDGIGNDGSNDGYVTVTAQQASDSMLGVVSANV